MARTFETIEGEEYEIGGRISRPLEQALLEELRKPDTKFTKDWFRKNSTRIVAERLSKALKPILMQFGKSGLSTGNVGELRRLLKYKTNIQIKREETKVRKAAEAAEAAAAAKNGKPDKTPPEAIPDIAMRAQTLKTYVEMMAIVRRVEANVSEQTDRIGLLEAAVQKLTATLQLLCPPIPASESQPAPQEQGALAYQAQ